MAGPTIASVSPSSGATSVPTNVTISIIFDQEVDLYRLKNGGIILEGPDESKVIGPDLLGAEPPETDEDEFLSSPAFKGIKDVSFLFSRVDGSGNSVNYYDYGDTGDAGAIYRTKVELTPKEPLQSLTEYTVYIIGDEDTSDEYDYGLSCRTVYDTEKGPNLSAGDALFYGGYTGSVRQQFNIEITSAGSSGTAEYTWYTSLDPTSRSATTSPSYRLLKEGVYVKFPQGHSYRAGDIFTVWCDVPVFMEGSYKFSFTTAQFAPETIPTSSTTLSGTSSTSSSSSLLSVVSTNPLDREAMVDSESNTITVTFGANLNASTITDSTVTVKGQSADGLLTRSYTSTITKSLSISGETLTITLGDDQVYDNNVISVILDSTIADTDGNTLGSDYEFFYGTTYSPFYAGIRQVQLRLGSFASSIPDETIALAILEASNEAYALTPPSSNIVDTVVFERARIQFTVCFATYILLGGGNSSLGGSVRKRLGDFDVSRSPGNSNNPLDDLKDCMDYNQALIENGGSLGPKHKPEIVVKGQDDPDSPHYGRLWEIPGTPMKNTKVKYSTSRRWYGTNLGRSRNYTKKSRWGR